MSKEKNTTNLNNVQQDEDSNKKTRPQEYTTSAVSIDLSKGTTEGNPDEERKESTAASGSGTGTATKILPECSNTAQLALILVVFCDALAASSAFAAFPAFSPATRWLVYASFYFGQLASTLLVACAPSISSRLLGRRPTVLLPLAGLAAAQVLYGFSYSLPLWAAARALCGFFAGGGAAYARAVLGAAPDAPRLLVCSGLAYSTGVAVGSTLCMNFQQLFTTATGVSPVVSHSFFLDYPQAPVGLAVALLVLLVLVYALFFARSQEPTGSASGRVPKVLPRRFLLVGGFVFAFSVFAVVYSGALSSVWFVSERGLLFGYDDTVILCFQFVFTAMAVHLALSYICTSSTR